MSKPKKVYLRYSYYFQIGSNEHCVEAYEEYYPETGLQGKMLFYGRSPRKRDIFRKLEKEPFSISTHQWETLNRVSKEKPHTVIIEPDGAIKRS